MAGAAVALLPECALFLSSNQVSSRAHALAIDCPQVERLRSYAGTHRITLIVGSLIMQINDQILNRTLVIDSEGQIQASYDKIHLFDVDLASGESYRESALFDAGTNPQLTRINDWSVGLSICFDLRFPSLYRHYALAGAELIVVPAAFTRSTGEAHWDTLLRARAIENGCFVAGAGQCGVTREGRETYGHSVVYDPWGACLGRLDDAPGVLTIEMDRSKVEAVRASMPVMSKHRNFRT
jgi:predicted amidohydrolase